MEVGGERFREDSLDNSEEWTVDKTGHRVPSRRYISITGGNLNLNGGLLEVVGKDRSLELILRSGEARILTKRVETLEIRGFEIIPVDNIVNDPVHLAWSLFATPQMYLIHHPMNAHIGKWPGRLLGFR